MPKHLDDVMDGEPYAVLPVRGSTVEAGCSPDGQLVVRRNGARLAGYEAEVLKDFTGMPINAKTARDLAERCRRDFPAA